MKKIIFASLVFVCLITVCLYLFFYSNSLAVVMNNGFVQPNTAAEKNTAVKNWEATAGGNAYKKWKSSQQGINILASAANVNKQVKNERLVDAVVTSASLPAGARLGYGLMVKVEGEDCILSFGVENAQLFLPLQRLQVNDKIRIKVKAVLHAPKYAYPILSGDYVEQSGRVLYKRVPRKGGC